jgi:hypothetical protein
VRGKSYAVGINDGEKFIRAWGIWERGRSHGIAEAIELVDKFLCGGGGLAEEQREILLRLYDSLLEINTRSVSAGPPRTVMRGWRRTARLAAQTDARSRMSSSSNAE